MNNETNITPGAAAAVLPVVKIRVVDIVPDPKNQVRDDEDGLARLCGSIEKDGLLQPIILRRIASVGGVNVHGKTGECYDVLGGTVGDMSVLYSGRDKALADAIARVYRSGGYMIVAGERRWTAHRMLRLEEIEARVVEGDSQLALVRKRAVENLHRENLNPVQEARQYQELIDTGMSQTEAAEMAGVDQSTMSNRLRILKLPARVLRLIEAGKLTRAHGIALLRFEAWPVVLEAIALLAVDLAVGSKRLEKGLPFCGHNEVGLLVVEVWGHQLPADWRKDPAVFEADPLDDVNSGNFYVLDVKRWKEGEAARLRDRAKAEDAERAARGAAPGAKENAAKVAAEAAEAREKSRARREKILASLSKATAAIRAKKVPPGYLMAKLVEAAISGGYSHSTLEQAFASTGVRPKPGVMPGSMGQGLRRVGVMRTINPADLLSVAVAAILIREANQALKEPRMTVDSIEGMATYAPKPSRAEEALGRAVKAAQAVGGNRAGKTAAVKQLAKLAKAKGGKVAPAKSAAIPRGKRTMRAKITDEVKRQVKQLVYAGRTGQEIAKALGISAPSVQNIRKELGFVKAKAEARQAAQEGAAAK